MRNDLLWKLINKSNQELDEKKTAVESINLNREATLDQIPLQVRKHVLADFLDDKSVAVLSSCHSALYTETKDISYWKKKLLAAGCHEDLLNKVIQKNVISNYKNLYRALTCFDYFSRGAIISVWELLGLSGELKAIAYAIDSENVTADTKSDHGVTLMHYVALSGSVIALEAAFKIKDSKGQQLDPFAKTNGGITIAHYAALSGSEAALRAALKVQNSKGQQLDPLTKTKNGETIAHFAAWSGSIAILEAALKVQDRKGQQIDPFAKTNGGFTIAHYAAQSGSAIAVAAVFEVQNNKGQLMDPFDKTNDGLTIAHLAAYSGSVTVLAAVLKIRDSKGQQIDPFAKSTNGETIAHLAARSGSVAVLEATLKVQDSKGQQIDPFAKTAGGLTIAHYAARSGSVTVLAAVLKVQDSKGQQIDPFAKSYNGQTLLHLAALECCSVDVIIHLRLLGAKRCDDFLLEQNPFDPKAQDDQGRDVFWYAKQSKIEALIIEVLLAPIETLKAQQNNDALDLESKSNTKKRKIM